MKRIAICIILVICALLFPAVSYAENAGSIIVATGDEVPIDNELPPEYRVPEEYTENAVQFITEDGVLLCGYVLGEGRQGITLGHANGWMVKSWLPFGERLVDAGYMIIITGGSEGNLPCYAHINYTSSAYIISIRRAFIFSGREDRNCRKG